MEIIKGKTDTGFEFEIDPSVGDDWELLESIVEADKNTLALIDVLNRIFKPEKINELKEHVRDENGIVSTTKMSVELANIFSKIGELKNS